ncbi:MAG: hypothetical protein J5780_02955, partial [Treponema sp.]|nr:hypothetical protein [Treponema sp.]
YDFIFDGSGNDVVISSVAPVYVYTVYAPEDISYEICKNWSVDQWAGCYEDTTRSKPQILDFDSNAKPRKYSFPGFSIYDDYGLCGAVVVCFHGGYRCVSRVFEH